ncbi:MAG TPA: hypothetical protein VJO13_11240 [Ktedonobacterales bacterium]|nr:hypothetical protein [Ktedonobacterales bacterium]
MHDRLDTSDKPPAAPLTVSERTAIDGLLRWQLGRRMTVCLLALTDTHADSITALTERLTSIEEIRVLPPAPSAEEGLRQAAQTDTEIVLVWLPSNDEREVAAATALLERAEAMGLRDHSFLALIGSHVTRDQAHQLLFEEGYPASTPTAQLLWNLAHEAIARDELRRRGSSPPCYL